MSYDLTLRADPTYSEYVSLSELQDFGLKLPEVRSNVAKNLALGDSSTKWMEIDLEVVTDEGDFIPDADPAQSGINCIRFHIPYAFLGQDWQQVYLPTALAIAELCGWQLLDDQSGAEISGVSPPPAGPEGGGKPWWRFW